jgi:hypothetical protein
MLTLLAVRGRIVDPDGRGVPGATVRLRGLAAATTESVTEPRAWPPMRPGPGVRDTPFGEAISGGGGVFEIAPRETSLREGKTLVVSATAWIGTALYTQGGDTLVDYELVPAGKRKRLRRLSAWSYGATFSGDVDERGVLDLGEIRVKPRCVVTVRVRVNEVPVPGLRLRAETFSARGWWFPSFPVDEATDREGVARFEGPLLEDARMRIGPFERPGYAVEEPVVDLGSGSVDLDVDLVPEAILEGIVFDDRGRPVPRARVSTWTGRVPACETDEHGHYTIHGLAPGPVRLSIGTDGDALANERAVVFAAPARDANVTLEAAASVSVTIAAPEGADVTVELVEPGSHASESGSVDETGTFETTFSKVHPGTLRVLARARGFAPALSAPLALGQRDAVSVKLRLERSRTLSGKTVDENGRPLEAIAFYDLEGVSIELHREAKVIVITPGKVPPESVEDGSFALDELPPGDVELVFKDGSRADAKASRPVRVPPGTTELADPVVIPGGR